MPTAAPELDLGLGRVSLLEKLEAVAPGLADGSIPILSHIWFTGAALMTFNDTIAVAVPYEQDAVIGALPGRLLLDFVRAISRDNVRFEAAGNGVRLTAPGSAMRANFPILPPSDFAFQWPDTAPEDILASVPVDAAWRAAAKACLRSCGKGGHHPETHGVTVITSPGKAVMYGTDGLTLTRALAPVPDLAGEPIRAILPAVFCELMAARPDEGGVLTITANYAEYVADGFSLYGRTRACPEPLDFDKIVAGNLPPAVLKASIPIPGNLVEMLARSCIITKDTVTGDPKVMFTVKDGALTLESAAERGDNRDKIKFPGHPNVQAKFRPGLIFEAIADFKRVIIQQNAMALLADTVLYLISSTA